MALPAPVAARAGADGRPQPSTQSPFRAGDAGPCGLPATVVPPGLSADGLPAGEQLVGPVFADPEGLRFFRGLELEYRGLVPALLA